jgi:hypothetical protein
MEHGIPCCETGDVSIQGATSVCGAMCDSNYYRHVGWRENNACIKEYFAPRTIQNVSRKITELLQGVNKQGRPILVPNNVICSVMSTVYENFRPQTGDIYSRYIIPTQNQQNNVQNMIDQVIEIIVSQVKTEIEMCECNSKLTKWTTVLGDFNEHGLTQTPPIKVLHKRPDPMLFNMNY